MRAMGGEWGDQYTRAEGGKAFTRSGQKTTQVREEEQVYIHDSDSLFYLYVMAPIH